MSARTNWLLGATLLLPVILSVMVLTAHPKYPRLEIPEGRPIARSDVTCLRVNVAANGAISTQYSIMVGPGNYIGEIWENVQRYCGVSFAMMFRTAGAEEYFPPKEGDR